MKPGSICILSVILGLACGCAQKSETPSDPINAYLPTGLLRSFGERQLAAAGTNHVYRFVCNRTFHEPFCIVVSVNSDGTGSLTKKMLSGQGGYDLGEIKEKGQVSLSAPQIESLLKLLEREQFWTITPSEPVSALGADGSTWFIEGVRTNCYHMARRSTPKTDTPVGRIGRHMIELADWEIRDLY
jgi:hypothetical protein